MSTRNGNRGAQNDLFELIALDEEMRRANILPLAHAAGARHHAAHHAHYNGPSLFELVEMDERSAHHPSPRRSSSSPKKSPKKKTPNNKGTPSRFYLTAQYNAGSNGEMLPPTPVLTPIFTPAKRNRAPGPRTGQKTQPLFPNSYANHFTPRTLQRLYTTPDNDDALSVLSVPEIEKTVLLMRPGQRIMTPSNLKMINASTPCSPYGWNRVGNHVRTVGVRRTYHHHVDPTHSPRTRVPSSARKSHQAATPRKITILETGATPGEKLKLTISSSAKKSHKNATPDDKPSAVKRNRTM